MDGDFSALKEITEISQKSNAITIVDDAHGDFVVGKDGKGTPEYFKVAKKIDLYISSLSKGLGSFGGYVSSQNNVIDMCINKSKSFIYTSALPSFLVEHSIKRIQSNRELQQKKLHNNVDKLSKGLKSIGYEINSKSQIIPIINMIPIILFGVSGSGYNMFLSGIPSSRAWPAVAWSRRP